MSNIVLKVENLSKLYRIGEVGTGTISHDLNRWWAKLRNREDPYSIIGQENDRSNDSTSDYVWSLKDVNFEVEKGDVLGIIGKNGAGKSTLLKIISQITSPTTGCVKSKGKIASLLEVGTGMHPEMTARENIFLNGAILGMTKNEIKSKFDEIIDFSGCKMYIDTPVKRFSSGMRVRLGFAVAAFLEPEILIVDEVLAVGDAEFQKKAIGKMKEVSKDKGRTVLFVSHNMTAIQNLCNKGLILKRGKVDSFGDINEIINLYIRENLNLTNSTDNKIDVSNLLRSAGKQAVIKKAWIEDSCGNAVSSVSMKEPFKIKFEFESKIALKNVLFGFGIENEMAIRITSLNNEISGDEIPIEMYKGIAELNISSQNLLNGNYFVSLSVVANGNEWVDYIEQAISFEVIASDVYNSGKLINNAQGVVFLNGNINANII